MPEFSATLGFRGEVRVPLNGDHSTIVKYVSEQDNNYRVVSRTLSNLVRDARNKKPQTYLLILGKILILHSDPSQNPLAVPSQTNSFESVFHVPHEQNPYFTGRDELLETIHTKIQDEHLKGYKHRSHSSDSVELEKHKLP